MLEKAPSRVCTPFEDMHTAVVGVESPDVKSHWTTESHGSWRICGCLLALVVRVLNAT
jgi:hypothetical protein